MDIQQIRYFLEVAKHKSFSKAADRLFVTQPILTRCVKNLEQELGVPLIIRSTKQFCLTDAGNTLVRYGQDLLQQHADIYRHIQDVSNVQTGVIRISSPGVLLDMYFPKLVTRYRREHPGVHIYIQEKGSVQVAQDIIEGAADIGLAMLPLEHIAQFDVFPLIQDVVHAVVQQDHPFAQMKQVPLSLLKDMDIITYSKSNTLYHTLTENCNRAGFSPIIVFQSTMPNFILDTIEHGTCVGVLPAPILRRFSKESLISVPITPHIPWEIVMITRKERYLSHAARNFLSFIQSHIGDEKPIPADRSV